MFFTFQFFDVLHIKFGMMPKKLKGDPLGFCNIRSVAKHQKNEGGPFGDFFWKKSLTMPEKN